MPSWCPREEIRVQQGQRRAYVAAAAVGESISNRRHQTTTVKSSTRIYLTRVSVGQK
jgi:hypothetical protein